MIVIKQQNNEIYFKVIHYPDGQRTIQLDPQKISNFPIFIKVRLLNFAELEILSCVISALKQKGLFIEKIIFYYLFGLRSDRVFSDGQPNYLTDVLAPIINNFEIPIEIIEPHSKHYKCIKNSKPYYFYPHAYFITDEYFSNLGYNFKTIFIGADSLVKDRFPDIKFQFIKTRNSQNYIDVHLDDTNIYFLQRLDELTTLIIYDDLCDDSNIFIKIAEYLKLHNIKNDLILFVIHGIFSGNSIKKLKNYYKFIICTDSYRKIDNKEIIQIKLEDYYNFY